MHVRINMLAGDPARMDEATRYLEGTVKPHVEALAGNRGLACLTNADLGVCLVASYWDTHDAMINSDQAVQVSRKEVTQLLDGTVTVDVYEVPVWARRSRPGPGAGVRMARFDAMPDTVDSLIDQFRTTGVPALMDMPGFCSAHMMVDRTTGRAIVATAWENMDALAASRTASARLRTTAAERAHLQIRAVEEYKLAFTSVREGDTRSLIERSVELWNARDREGWLACHDLFRLEMQAPGGLRLTGREAAETFWHMWTDAFPDNRLETVAIHTDDRGGVFEGRGIGTHTGTLRSPAGEIPATGRPADVRFTSVYEINEGNITSEHLYFDQIDLLAQLGLAPGTPASALPTADPRRRPCPSRCTGRPTPGSRRFPPQPARRAAVAPGPAIPRRARIVTNRAVQWAAPR